MYTFLLVLLVLVSLLLVGVVLLQAGKGSGLAANFGGTSSSTDAFVGTRQAANLLTKATWWLAGLFMGIAYLMSLITVGRGVPRSVLDQGARPASTAPATTVPSTVPLTPAPATPTPAPTGTPAPSGGAKPPAGKAPTTTTPAKPPTQ